MEYKDQPGAGLTPDVSATLRHRPAPVPENSVDAIRHAALLAFAEQGYEGTTMRQIADRAHMSLAGIYHHFPAKNDILFDLVRESLETMVAETETARSNAGPDPLEQLRTITAAHVRFHITHQLEAFVGATELRSFEGDRLLAISFMRRRQQTAFNEVVADLAETGYPIPYPDEVARAIVTMGMAVANWYRADGRLSPEEVCSRYADLAARLVGADIRAFECGSHTDE